MNRGYIRLYRCFADNAVWLGGKFSDGQAWIDLWLKASEKEETVCIRGKVINLDRGQLCLTEVTMAQRWGWSRHKVRNFLSNLEQIGEIKQHKYRGIKVITICDYNLYQGEL